MTEFSSVALIGLSAVLLMLWEGRIGISGIAARACRGTVVSDDLVADLCMIAKKNATTH